MEAKDWREEDTGIGRQEGEADEGSVPKPNFV